MFEKINADESLRVLVYVCLPLFLLLVLALIFRAMRRPRFVATFSSFTLTINQVGREDGFVAYSASGIQTAFGASLGRDAQSGHRQISVEIPREMDIERARNIVHDLTLGLTDLRYEYVIFRKREPRQVAQEERDAARDQLRQMGFDTDELVAQRGQVTLLSTRNGRSMRAKDLAISLPKIQSLINKTKGIEERIEILESSVPRLAKEEVQRTNAEEWG